MSQRNRAFTLVEMLVVAGILGLLVALLLPAMSAARKQAQTVLCMTNLRELTAAAMLHGQDHQGFLPLSGEIVIPKKSVSRDPNSFPRALNDSFRRRYVYATNTANSSYTVVPMPGALAPYMDVRDLPFDDWDALDQRLNDLAVRKHFSCPSTDALDRAREFHNSNDTTLVGQGTMVVFVTDTRNFISFWATNSDYAINEGVMGFNSDSRYGSRRLRGNLNGLQQSDRVVLFSDAKLRANISYWVCPWICWTPSLYSSGRVTLADAIDNNGKAADGTMFDRKRHGGRMNIAFADGHVQTVPINRNELQNAYLLPQ